MVSFDSPLGKKKINNLQMRELDIPNDNGDMGPPMENGEVVVRRRPPIPQVNRDQIRDYQAHIQQEHMPTYEEDPVVAEQAIKQARVDKMRGVERLSEGARKRIEMLVGMTRSTRSVEIEENTYVLQTLKSKEMRDALLSASAFDGSLQSPFEIRKQLLARSLIQIAGLPIEQFVGSYDLEAKLIFMDELDEHLMLRLYDEYLVLVSEAQGKYAIKTPETGMEVVEDLKK